MSKYESFGVDAEKQKSQPTLVEKAQQEEAKAAKPQGITPAEDIQKANESHKTVFKSPVQGNGRLEEVLTGGHYSEAELTPSTTGPSVQKAKLEAAKEEAKK